MATLYELTAEYKELLDMAEEQNLTQADIKDTLEGMDYEFEDKADGYAKVLRSWMVKKKQSAAKSND